MLFFAARKRSLGQGDIFAPVCHSVHKGEYLGTYTPGSYIPCPLRQVHPPGQVYPLPPQAGRPPGRYTPWAGTPSRAGTPPTGTPPGNACWDTFNKREVRILLECILVKRSKCHLFEQNGMLHKNASDLDLLMTILKTAKKPLH